MLRPVALDHIRPASDHVRNHTPTGLARKPLYHFARESRRKSRKGTFEVDSRNLPVSGGTVLPRRSRSHCSPCPGSVTSGTHSFEGTNIPQSQLLQARKVETAARACDVSECVAPTVSVTDRVGSFSDADAVEDDDDR